jgi:hypothetical protein
MDLDIEEAAVEHDPSVLAQALADAEVQETASEDISCHWHPFLVPESHRTLSDDEKTNFIRAHPIQPQTEPGKVIKLPFDKDRVYILPNGSQRAWLSFCQVSRCLHCWVCMAFSGTNFKNPSAKRSTFITGWGSDGLWASGSCYKAIDRHESSAEHEAASDAFFAFSHEYSVKQLTETKSRKLLKEQITERREVVLRLINICFILGRQGIGYRGPENSEAAYNLSSSANHGNFLELVKGMAVHDPVLSKHLADCIQQSEKRHIKHPHSRGRGGLVTFLSKSIMKKILDIITEMIQELILKDIAKNGGKFSFSLDSTQDVSVKELTCICLRYVDNFGPVERLIDIFETPDTTGEGLFDVVCKCLFQRLQLLVNNLCGFAADGALNLSGHIKGLRGRLLEIAPLAVYQYCLSHLLARVLVRAAESHPKAISFFNLLRDSATTISESHKRVDVWKLLCDILFSGPTARRMPMKIGATRWWAKERALSRTFCTEDSVLPIIVACVERIANNPDLPPKARAKAEGDLGKWCQLETVVLGVFFRHVFSLAEPVSVYLQSKQMDHVQASRLASDLISNLSKLNLDSIIEEA